MIQNQQCAPEIPRGEIRSSIVSRRFYLVGIESTVPPDSSHDRPSPLAVRPSDFDDDDVAEFS